MAPGSPPALPRAQEVPGGCPSRSFGPLWQPHPLQGGCPPRTGDRAGTDRPEPPGARAEGLPAGGRSRRCQRIVRTIKSRFFWQPLEVVQRPRRARQQVPNWSPPPWGDGAGAEPFPQHWELPTQFHHGAIPNPDIVSKTKRVSGAGERQPQATQPPKPVRTPNLLPPSPGTRPGATGAHAPWESPGLEPCPALLNPRWFRKGQCPGTRRLSVGTVRLAGPLGASVPGEQDDGGRLDDPSPFPGPADPSDPSARGERVCAGLPQACDRDTHPVPSPAPRHSPAEGCRAQAPRGKRMERPRCKRER